MEEVVGADCGGVSKHVDRAIWLVKYAGGRFSDHLREPLIVPVGGPGLAIVHTERETAGPPSQPGDLPATNEGIQNTSGVAAEMAAFAKRQFSNPVGVDLMG